MSAVIQSVSSSILLFVGLAFGLLGSNIQSRVFGLVSAVTAVLELLVLFGVIK